jgi:uncharacterized protein YjbI with pentapeptide repeats
MPARRGVSAGRDRAPRTPNLPDPLDSVDPADPGRYDLVDEASYRRLGLVDLDMSQRRAEAVEFDRCRLRNVDLNGGTLVRASFADTLVENGNLANLRVEKSSMLRARLSMSRLTGLHWVDGVLRDVLVAQCRADLASFRFTAFHQVAFEGCNLTRADFQNADLTGVRFTDCDLTGAQFSQAKMAGTRFSGCVLAGVGGVTSFAGAIVARQDLVALSHTLAAALGIQLEGDGDGDGD